MNLRIAQWVRTAAVLAMAALVPAVAADRRPTARDIYYERATDSEADRDTLWMGVRTSILLKTQDKEGVAQIREVGDQGRFHDGDRFRFRVQSNIDGYLYLFLRDSNGDTRLLFPYDTTKSRTNKMRRYQTKQIPEKDWFAFDKDSGIERVYMFVSAKPIEELEDLATEGGKSYKLRELERLIARTPATKTMFQDEDTLDDGGDIGATYYVEKPISGRNFLVRRFELVHSPK
jgi:hypothetical protein